MVKPRSARLLALFRAALLLVACGLESKTGRAVASAAGGSRNTRRPSVCGPGAEQPQCRDPAHGEDGAGGPTDEAPEAETVCESGECASQQQPTPQAPPQQQQQQQEQQKPQHKQKQQQQQQQQQQQRQQQHVGTAAGAVDEGPAGITPSRFQNGDIIELYNTESRDIQIVFPSLVRGRDERGGYTVTKTTDGKEVENIPDRHMHPYTPYPQGGEALCNIGDFKPARPIVVRCTVLEYTPAAARGALVLQGRYRVRVAQTKVSEEYETELPVWKLQRRYRAVTDM